MHESVSAMMCERSVGKKRRQGEARNYKFGAAAAAAARSGVAAASKGGWQAAAAAIALLQQKIRC